MIYTDTLTHHGILGQKWGVRRYQKEDGSLTEAGKKRYTSAEIKEARAKRDELQLERESKVNELKKFDNDIFEMYNKGKENPYDSRYDYVKLKPKYEKIRNEIEKVIRELDGTINENEKIAKKTTWSDVGEKSAEIALSTIGVVSVLALLTKIMK